MSNSCNNIVLPTNLQKGDDGTSITWKGNLSSFPSSPANLWAFYHTTNKISYIYNADSGQWEVLAKDGQNASGSGNVKILGNNVTQVTHNLDDSTTSAAKTVSFDPTQENFTDGSVIEIESLIKMIDGATASGTIIRSVKVAIGNVASPSSAPVYHLYQNDTTDGQVINFNTRINFTDVTVASNNLFYTSEYRVDDVPSNFYHEYKVGTQSLDLTQDIYIHMICEVLGSGTLDVDFEDNQLYVKRILK